MENITFNLTELHKHGSAFFEFLALRKQFFVDQLGWDIPHDDDVEMDQYDNPKAYYSLVVKDGKVVGGMRTMATTAQWGSHTYMLRDAVDGKLIGIPADILPAAEVTPTVWEATRIVISEDIKTHAERSACLGMLLDGVVSQAREHGGTEIMALCPPVFARTMRQLGYPVYPIGEPYINAHDNRKYVAMKGKIAGIRAKTSDQTDAATNQAASLSRPTYVVQQNAVHAPSKI
ncbi:acyl homoserine lactone synthase [Yoonia maricola]|uniref:Acyl-homoserine-lactone synthase n=1 Tax=Yoonia maricola TaxID=420999 RepID=A0A2M8WMM7_9RHOB|nr:acyl-homoserine-lactone synthase [Yoonia maricola]PJI92184.1 acyl homoserine lactone synthase [Yoonia maricola]